MGWGLNLRLSLFRCYYIVDHPVKLNLFTVCNLFLLWVISQRQV